MQPVSTVEAFLAAPVGRYFVGTRYLAWCYSPTLAGSGHWGRLGAADIVELTRFLEWRPPEVGMAARFAVEQLRRHLRDRHGATSLPDAARALGRSPRSLQRDLRDAGRSFRDELNQARVEAARELLVDSDLKLEAIAGRVGCASLAQFSRLFRQLAGEPPSEFRARHRAAGKR